MILPDANLLLYAENSGDAHHAAATEWLHRIAVGDETIGFCWQTLSAFIRIATNPRVFRRPLSIAEASERVDYWLDLPRAVEVRPGRDHWQLFRSLLHESQATANLVMDARLAALAIGHGATLHTTDADFRRFKGLRWVNPLAG